MRRYRATIVAGIVIALVLVGTFALVGHAMQTSSHDALVVRVHDGDGNTHVYSLGQDGEHVITSSLGTNTISIQDGSVRMAQADCPNQSCLQQEPVSRPGPQIICLPHKLWIEVVGAGDKDEGSLNEDRVTWSNEKGAGDTPTADLDDLDTIAR